MKYAFIEVERVNFRVRTLCRVLGVKEQGFYLWRKSEVSERKRQDECLSAQIRIVHAESRARYGSPRVHDELKAKGMKIGRKRVARLMRQEGLKAKAARKFRVTTDSNHNKTPAPDLVNRNFTAPTRNKVWVSDITYLWTKEGWLYLAVFIDLYSRMVVGWAIDVRINADLVTTAFRRACMRRTPPPGLIVHSDRGSQYASYAFRKALRNARALQSMGSLGDCWDNAVAESFFHSLKIEALYGEEIETRRQMEYEMFDYIERFYNRSRRHSTIGRVSPMQYEQLNSGKAAA